MEGGSSSKPPTLGFPPGYSADASEVMGETSMQPTGFVSGGQLQKEAALSQRMLDLGEVNYASEENEITSFSDEEFDRGVEGKLERFKKETASDGESAWVADLDGMLDLPEELQLGEGSASKQEEVVVGAETEKFEQFDVVQDFSSHHFANHKPPTGSSDGKNKIIKLLNKLHIINGSEMKHQEPTGPRREWVRRIQQEWKSLERDLPEGIFVRVYEERMDLLRAAIVGSAGTPYHDGLFFFDVCFPHNYPNVPPRVHHHSHGLQLNPNLYATGKVCLSLLGTAYGRGCEKWNPKSSTLLQVLVSIQAIVFNTEPFFNAPVISLPIPGLPSASKRSLCYNEVVFLLSCKTMLYTLRQPPQHFEVLVASHFRKRGRAVLLACKAYMEGATVGSEALSRAHGGGGSSATFVSSLKNYFDSLLKEFEAKGADCEGLPAVASGASNTR